MNNKSRKRLIRFCSFVLLTEFEQTDKVLLNQLNDQFRALLSKILNLFEADKVKRDDCDMIAQSIDRLLFLSGELTLRNIEPSELDLIKEQLWHLLSILDQYSQNQFKHSVW